MVPESDGGECGVWWGLYCVLLVLGWRDCSPCLGWLIVHLPLFFYVLFFFLSGWCLGCIGLQRDFRLWVYGYLGSIRYSTPSEYSMYLFYCIRFLLPPSPYLPCSWPPPFTYLPILSLQTLYVYTYEQSRNHAPSII